MMNKQIKCSICGEKVLGYVEIEKESDYPGDSHYGFSCEDCTEKSQEVLPKE